MTEQLAAVKDRVQQLEVAKDLAYESRALEQQVDDQAMNELLLQKKEELEQKLEQPPVTEDMTQQWLEQRPGKAGDVVLPLQRDRAL